jgi:superfamily II DNA or RNA helicase
MTIRDKRQKEFAQVWINHGRFGILNLCPRFGKIRTTIHILNELQSDQILIAYPDNKIKQSWIDEFELMGYKNNNITYTTHRSINKYIDVYDLVIIDEIHLLSPNQRRSCEELILSNSNVLGLTGTLSKWTKKDLQMELGLQVMAEYPIEKAIEEGVIADYEITVIQVPLDNTVVQTYTKKNIRKTELQQFQFLSGMINKMMYSGANTMFHRLARMRIIQNSVAKLNKTKQILQDNPDERILVFCGITKVADSLGIPSYHSKSKDKEALQRFAEGEGNHMAVVKIGNTGVTYKPLNKVIINYFDSNAENLAQKINRCMAMEYNTPDKKSHITIISSKQSVEEKWLNKALEFFDKSKIKYA